MIVATNVLAMLAVIGSTPPDTIAIGVREALERALDVSPVIEAARSRADAGTERALQANAWPNPSLAVTAENVGQSAAFTGIEGFRGLEGQAVVRLPLPFGPERDGARRVADAGRAAAMADAEGQQLDVRLQVLAALARHVTDQALTESARSELESLDRFSEALALQASRGRAPRGDAARASLARGLAATQLARRESGLAKDDEDLARLLGYPSGTALQISLESCAPPTPRTEGQVVGAPELWAASARVDAARAAVTAAEGVRMPDLQPELGIRRTAGRTGLYLGLSAELPLFDRSSHRIAAARAEEAAALAEQREIAARWDAARSAARSVLSTLDAVGAQFDDAWFQSLEQTVTAAQARFDAGEGTLTELLDSRRARLAALDDYHTWLSEWWSARLELTRTEGRPAGTTLLCLDPFRETP